MSNEVWLEEGHHWDLHFEHVKSNNNAGKFTGGGWKWVLHTTDGGTVDSNVNLLVNRNTPQLLFGKEEGRKHFTVVQFLPFNLAGKTLQNDTSDGYQTNRANAIQMEMVGFTHEIPEWSDLTYKALANLFTLIQHRVDIPTKAPKDFSVQSKFTDKEWVEAEGVVGHMHAPDNTHIDPFRFAEGKFLKYVHDMPDGGYNL